MEKKKELKHKKYKLEIILIQIYIKLTIYKNFLK